MGSVSHLQSVPGTGLIPGYLYRIPEAARLLKVSDRTVHRLIAAGTLPTVRIGAATRITAADLDAYVQAARH
jgi:excisionase family DNA binding protein